MINLDVLYIRFVDKKEDETRWRDMAMHLIDAEGSAYNKWLAEQDPEGECNIGYISYPTGKSGLIEQKFKDAAENHKKMRFLNYLYNFFPKDNFEWTPEKVSND